MRERLREALGVWAPMLVGVLLLVVAVNFLLTARAPGMDPTFRLDPVAATLCGSLVIGVGGLLVLSTYGRWRKVRATRRDPKEKTPANTENPDEESK